MVQTTSQRDFSLGRYYTYFSSKLLSSSDHATSAC